MKTRVRELRIISDKAIGEGFSIGYCNPPISMILYYQHFHRFRNSFVFQSDYKLYLVYLQTSGAYVSQFRQALSVSKIGGRYIPEKPVWNDPVGQSEQKQQASLRIVANY